MLLTYFTVKMSKYVLGCVLAFCSYNRIFKAKYFIKTSLLSLQFCNISISLSLVKTSGYNPSRADSILGGMYRRKQSHGEQKLNGHKVTTRIPSRTGGSSELVTFHHAPAPKGSSTLGVTVVGIRLNTILWETCSDHIQQSERQSVH